MGQKSNVFSAILRLNPCTVGEAVPCPLIDVQNPAVDYIVLVYGATKRFVSLTLLKMNVCVEIFSLGTKISSVSRKCTLAAPEVSLVRLRKTIVGCRPTNERRVREKSLWNLG